MKKIIAVAVILGILSCLTAGMAADYSVTPSSSVWYTYDSSLHWFYRQLNQTEQKAFSSRYDAYALGNMSLWDISGFGLTDYEQKRVEFALNNDCPELMLCSPTIKIGKFSALLGDQDWFTEHKVNFMEELSSCLRRLEALRSSSYWGYSDLDKEKAFDMEIARKTSYLLDNDGPEGTLHLTSEVRSAASAIVNRTAVCEGFSRSTQLAMRYFGIPCIYVCGNTSKGNHAWNLVCINGRWCHYDATWNSNGGYMNLSDSEICRDRTLGGEYSQYGFSLPGCR